MKSTVLLIIFSLLTTLFSCRNSGFVESPSLTNSIETKNSTSIDDNDYFDSIASIPCITLLDTLVQDIRIKINCIYANQLVMEATIGNTTNYDTVNYPFFHHFRDGLILYNDGNKHHCGNFCWFTNGKYGIFSVNVGLRTNLHVYSLVINKNNQLVFGNDVGVNPYYGFVDVKKSKLYLHSGNPQDFTWVETDSGNMESYYRHFYHYHISNKGLQLKKTASISDSCIDKDDYSNFDEDLQTTVRYYLQAIKK